MPAQPDDLALKGAAALLLLSLLGCSGARVNDVSTAAAGMPAPRAILVEVDATSSASADLGATARSVGAVLGRDLVARLRAANLLALERSASRSLPDGDAVLRVDVDLADDGNRVERLVIGFGAGRARLSTTATLERMDRRALTRFDTASDSGLKPGLLLPGAVAAATGNLIHLAIGGGIDVALNARDGLSAPAEHTAGAIVKQLRTTYAANGWRWPKAG